MTSNHKVNPFDAVNNTEFISFQPPSLNHTAITSNPGVMMMRDNEKSMNEEIHTNQSAMGKVRGHYPSTHHNPLLSVSGERNTFHN
jgi:hypothetical protein